MRLHTSDLTQRLVLVTLLAVAGAGCDKDPRPSASASSAADSQVGVTGPRQRDALPEQASAVVVDDRIAKACSVPRVHFAFDSKRVRSGEEEALDAIATCVTKGPLAGEALKLVGHADPRGTLEYNFALGQRRAGHVAEYLIDAGVPAKRISSSSRGELDADGSSLAGWARDRRVEVLLDD